MTQTNMELEELMANRELLNKLSYQDDQPGHISCRPSRKPNSLPSRIPDCVPNRGVDYNPVRNTEFFTGTNPGHMDYIPNRALDWEETNLLTPSTLSMHKPSPILSTRTADNKSEDELPLPPPPPPPDIVYVPEGYGCKIPKRLRKLFEILKNLFLLLYIFGMPVVLYQLQTRLQITRRRIESFNRLYPANFSPSTSTSNIKHKKSEGEESAVAASLSTTRDGVREYQELSLFEKETFDYLRHIRQLVVEKERRLDMIVTLSRVLKANPNFINQVYKNNCDECCKSTCGGEQEGGSSPNSDIREAFVKTYTRWGKKTCPDRTNTSLLYSGIMVSTSNLRGSTGAKYLCLHDTPSQSPNKKVDVNSQHVQNIYSTLVDRSGVHDNFQTNISITPGFHQAFCSVCQVTYRYDVIMMPGTTACPAGWTREYAGYISGQMKFKRRTEFLCLDEQPDTKRDPLRLDRALTTLNFVESKCWGRPCPTGADYIQYAELACVVCSR